MHFDLLKTRVRPKKEKKEPKDNSDLKAENLSKDKTNPWNKWCGCHWWHGECKYGEVSSWVSARAICLDRVNGTDMEAGSREENTRTEGLRLREIWSWTGWAVRRRGRRLMFCGPKRAENTGRPFRNYAQEQYQLGSKSPLINSEEDGKRTHRCLWLTDAVWCVKLAVVISKTGNVRSLRTNRLVLQADTEALFWAFYHGGLQQLQYI